MDSERPPLNGSKHESKERSEEWLCHSEKEGPKSRTGGATWSRRQLYFCEVN